MIFIEMATVCIAAIVLLTFILWLRETLNRPRR